MQQTRPSQRHIRRTRRPDAAGDPGPTRQGRGVGQGPVRTVRHEPARHLQAPPGAGTGRTHRAGSPGAVATSTASGGPAARHRRLGRPVPPPLGGELRTARRLSPRTTGQPGASEMETTMNATRIDRGSTQTTTHLFGGRRPRIRAHVRRTARAGLEGIHRSGASSRAGGASTARPQRSPRWTSDPAASGATSAAPPIARTSPSTASTSRSTRPRAIKWTFMFDVDGVGPQGGPETLHLRGRRRQDEGHLRRPHGLGRGARRRPGDRHGRRRDRDLGPPRGRLLAKG